jgi:hypothetical protein
MSCLHFLVCSHEILYGELSSTTNDLDRMTRAKQGPVQGWQVFQAADARFEGAHSTTRDEASVVLHLDSPPGYLLPTTSPVERARPCRSCAPTQHRS